MSTQTAEVKTTVHHARPAPEDHLCTCGKLREECVRSTVRTVWATRQTA